MNREELINLNMKDVVLNKWKSKLSYPLNHKDIEELENIIDYYEGLNQKYKEVIFTIKMRISAIIKKYEQKIDNEIDMGSKGDHFKICRYEENIKILKDILKEVE